MSFLKSFRATVQRRRKAKQTHGGRSRKMRFERLEPRALLAAEGSIFNLARSFDVTGIAGTPSASIDWGDGTSKTTATVTGGNTTGQIKFKFDYSLDASGFFADASRRTLLEDVGRIISSRLTDSLAAIQPSGINTWTASFPNPSGTGAMVQKKDLSIAANEILVFAGGRHLTGNEVGKGGFGGVDSTFGLAGWGENVVARGQTGALASTPTDFGPWGGAVTFESNPARTDWYFGRDPAAIKSNQTDFITIASHELTHLLGFGLAPSWQSQISPAPSRDTTTQRVFTGAKSRLAYDEKTNVPVHLDGIFTNTGFGSYGHWLESTSDGGLPTLMAPTIFNGTRKTLTGLDLAGLDDLGWDVVATNASLTAQHVYADNGIYTITATYSGSTIGKTTDSFTTTITNVNPTLTVVAGQTATRDKEIVINNIANISDPGFARSTATPPSVETFSFTINWGDRTTIDTGTATIDRAGTTTLPTLASFNGRHTYATAGTFTVTVKATDDDNGSDQETFQIVVSLPPKLSVELDKTTITENAGTAAATLTVSRSAPASSSPTTVNLASSDTTEATVPASVVIPAGSLSVTVPISAVDDTLLDGTQSVIFTATGSGLDSGTTILLVTDVETLLASFTAASVLENAAANTFFLTVTRSNTDVNSNVALTIAGNIPAQIMVPATATIPAGSREVKIPVQLINDDKGEPTLELVYVITAASYVSVLTKLSLLDDDPNKFQNPTSRFNVDGRNGIQVLDALVILNTIAHRKPNPILNSDTDNFVNLFPDVDGDYRISVLDALIILNEIRRIHSATGSGEAAPPFDQRIRVDQISSVEPLQIKLF